MYCLYMIDNASWGQKYYMKKDGFWVNVKIADELMRFETEDEAIDWAWTENPFRKFGATYHAEKIGE